GHRRNRVGSPVARLDEVRHDQLLPVHPRLGDEIAQRGAPPQSPRPHSPRHVCFAHVIASSIPSRFGQRASAVTLRPAATAAADVVAPMVMTRTSFGSTAQLTSPVTADGLASSTSSTRSAARSRLRASGGTGGARYTSTRRVVIPAAVSSISASCRPPAAPATSTRRADEG